MLFSVGLAATRRYLDYHRAVQACPPVGPHHQLPMLGVHPEYQGRQIGEQLLAAVQRWCAEDSASQGWSWIPAMRATWTSTSGTATARSAR